MGKQWQWQEVNASRATAENAAKEILEKWHSRRPRVLLSAVRGKRIATATRRYDLKFGVASSGLRALVRVDLYHAQYLGWLPIVAFSIWQTGEKGSLYLFEFNQNLAPMPVDPERTAVYQQLKEELLTEPLPRGFVL